MCFSTILSKKLYSPRKVYKVLAYKNGTLRSPVMDTPYILGRQYHVDINDIRKLIYASGNEHLIVNITEGLHSYTSIDVAMRLNSTDNLCFSAIIPAGATVVEGDKGNIVSTDLIVQPYYYVPVKIKGRILFYRKKKWNVKY